jgi:hypothetical protein
MLSSEPAPNTLALSRVITGLEGACFMGIVISKTPRFASSGSGVLLLNPESRGIKWMWENAKRGLRGGIRSFEH